VRGAEAPGDEHDNGPLAGLDNGVADDGAVIRQHPCMAEWQPDRGKLGTQECGVRVDGLAQQQLGADREQLGVRHRRRV
jgi:hypothetical protein